MIDRDEAQEANLAEEELKRQEKLAQDIEEQWEKVSYGKTFEERAEAAAKRWALMDEQDGTPGRSQINIEEFRVWDTENQKLKAEFEANREREIKETGDRFARDEYNSRLREAVVVEAIRDELDGEDGESQDNGEDESFAADETEKPAVRAKKSKNLDAGKSEAKKKAVTTKGTSDSSEKSYGGTGERKPGKGLIEGVKSWFKMMFGSGEKK